MWLGLRSSFEKMIALAIKFTRNNRNHTTLVVSVTCFLSRPSCSASFWLYDRFGSELSEHCTCNSNRNRTSLRKRSLDFARPSCELRVSVDLSNFSPNFWGRACRRPLYCCIQIRLQCPIRKNKRSCLMSNVSSDQVDVSQMLYIIWLFLFGVGVSLCFFLF